MKQAKIIVVANMKGGVGKTSTALAITHKLAESHKTLLLDTDKQGNSTDGMTANNHRNTSLYEVLTGACPLAKSIDHTENGDVLASTITMIQYTDKLNTVLSSLLLDLKRKYEYIVIDTSPEISGLTNCLFSYADEIVLTTVPSYDAIKGVQQEILTINRLEKNLKREISSGILFTMYNPRSAYHKEYADDITEIAESQDVTVFNARIPRSTAIEYAKDTRTPIYKHAPKNKAVMQYADFVTELLKELKG